MKPKITFTNAVLILSIFLFAMAGCQPKTASTEGVATQEATSSFPTTSEDGSIKIGSDIILDPALAQNDDSLLVAQYLYEGLVRLDANGEPQPALAQSWVISDDQLDYVFTLRPNAIFSDGTPITPDVIVDNFNRWFDPASPLHGNGGFKTWESIFLGYNGEKDENKRAKSQVDGIQKVDVNTVLLHLNRPVPETLVYLANPAFSILNTNALTTSGYGEKGSTIISSGPYVLSAWTDAGLTLSPNPEYWGTKPEGNLNFTWR
jgi:ABC-type transport system substrate-binding protein